MKILEEIKDTPRAIKSILEDIEEKERDIESILRDVQNVLFIGSGTSYNIGLVGASILRNNDFHADSVMGGEVLLSPNSISQMSPDLLVSISRSGETTETLQTYEKLSKKFENAGNIDISCYENSSLSHSSDLSIVSREGKEESVPATKSFSSIMTGVEYITKRRFEGANILKDFRDIPKKSYNMLEKAEPLAENLGGNEDLEKFVFLGTGEYYGIAREAALKMKEMTLSWSEAYPPLEFRHGPKAIVDENTLITVFYPGRGEEELKKLIEELQSLGGKVLLMGVENPNLFEPDYEIQIPSAARFIGFSFFLLPVQLMAYYRGKEIGLDLDNPRNLDMVVSL